MCTSSRSPRLRSRGFTLVELIIFIVIVGIGVAGILSVFQQSIASSADPLVRKQMLAAAESLLEEIVQKEYAKPSGSTVAAYGGTGWSRAQFDTVTDYQGYTATSIVDAAGNTVPGLTGYSIAPAVSVTTGSLSGGGATTVRTIVVSISGPQGSVRLTGYRGNY